MMLKGVTLLHMHANLYCKRLWTQDRIFQNLFDLGNVKSLGKPALIASS